MKKLTILLMVICFVFLMAGCGSADDQTDQTEQAVQEETTQQVTETTAPAVNAKVIDDVDENLGMCLPLGIDEISLAADGTLTMEPDDALEAALGEHVEIATGVSDVEVLPFGNGGYRSVIFVRQDGSVSALSTDALINQHEVEVMDNLGGYLEVVSVEGAQEVDASSILVVMSNGDKYPVDPYLK